MLNSRLIQGLLICCGFLVGLSVFFFYRQIPHPQNPYAKALDKADTLVLQQGSDKVELDQQGKEWQVKTPQGSFLATESDKVKTLLSSLRDVQVEDEITDRAEGARDYDVTPDSGIRVKLLAKTATLADGIFGKQAPDFTHIYFRFPDKPSVYLAGGLIRGELGGATVNDWRSHDLINIPEAQIQSITIQGKGFETRLARSSDTWTLNGKKVDPESVNVLVGTLAHFRAGDFVNPASEPTMTYDSLNFARIQLASDHSAVDLHVGSPDPVTHRYPVAISKDSGVAWITDAQGAILLRKPSDFKKLPST